MLSEREQIKWERRLRRFCILGGTVFMASLLVARPLAESFEFMWQVVPLLIVLLFALLIAGGTVWLLLQLSIAQHTAQDMAARLRPASIRLPRGF